MTTRNATNFDWLLSALLCLSACRGDDANDERAGTNAMMSSHELSTWQPPADAIHCPDPLQIQVRQTTSEIGQPAIIEQMCIRSEGMLHGDWIAWSLDGSKQASATFVNGKKQGFAFAYRRDGTIAARSEFAAGELQNYIAYHDNGREYLHAHYANGKMNGRTLKWHLAGQKMAEGEMRDNAKVGLWTWWYDNGNLEKRGHFQAGRRVGTWEAWDLQGQKLPDTVYSANAD